MPRRNQHLQSAQPLPERDMLRPFIPMQREWLPSDEWEKLQRERAQRRRDRTKNRQRQRTDRALDWTICCVPECDSKSYTTRTPWFDYLRGDSNERSDECLPLCDLHAGVAWRMAARDRDSHALHQIVASIEAARIQRTDTAAAAEDAETRRQRAAGTLPGHIYLLRQNGLIKVGWSGTIYDRLRTYGPDVDVLCIYPATRNDETGLHRTFRPYLAKGREWYQECQIITDHVAAMLAKDGTAGWDGGWTEPRRDAIRSHKSAQGKPSGLSI